MLCWICVNKTFIYTLSFLPMFAQVREFDLLSCSLSWMERLVVVRVTSFVMVDAASRRA